MHKFFTNSAPVTTTQNNKGCTIEIEDENRCLVVDIESKDTKQGTASSVQAAPNPPTGASASPAADYPADSKMQLIPYIDLAKLFRLVPAAAPAPNMAPWQIYSTFYITHPFTPDFSSLGRGTYGSGITTYRIFSCNYGPGTTTYHTDNYEGRALAALSPNSADEKALMLAPTNMKRAITSLVSLATLAVPIYYMTPFESVRDHPSARRRAELLSERARLLAELELPGLLEGKPTTGERFTWDPPGDLLPSNPTPPDASAAAAEHDEDNAARPQSSAPHSICNRM